MLFIFFRKYIEMLYTAKVSAGDWA